MALFDELEKIAEATTQEQKPTIKKWLKNTALIMGGAGAGTAAAMMADSALVKRLGERWAALPPTTKKYIIAPLMGATLVGAGLGGQKLMEERRKKDLE